MRKNVVVGRLNACLVIPISVAIAVVVLPLTLGRPSAIAHEIQAVRASRARLTTVSAHAMTCQNRLETSRSMAGSLSESFAVTNESILHV